MRSADEERALLVALVPAEYGRLFKESASFRHSVTTLALMLPAWIDGFAVHAGMIDEQAQRRYEAMIRQPVTVTVTGLEPCPEESYYRCPICGTCRPDATVPCLVCP